MPKTRVQTAVIAAALSSLPAIASHAAYLPIIAGPAYTVAAGGFMYPEQNSFPRTISNGGIAVARGEKIAANGNQKGEHGIAFSSSSSRELSALGTDPGGSFYSLPTDINASGVISGTVDKYSASHAALGSRPVRYNAGSSTPTELSLVYTAAAGYSNGTAAAINASGVIVGTSDKFDAGNNDLGPRPVRWAAGSTTPVEMPNLSVDSGGSSQSYPVRLNASGVSIGFAEKYNSSGADLGERAVRWNAAGTTITELGILGTSLTGITNARPSAINAAGYSVGSARKYASDGTDLGERATRWDATGNGVVELPGINTDTNGVGLGGANDINDSNLTVGYSWLFNGDKTSVGSMPTRWDAQGNPTALGTLGGNNSGYTGGSASAINSFGTAVGGCAVAIASDVYPSGHATYWTMNNVAVDLNSLIDPASGWILTGANGITDTGFITGIGSFDPDGTGPLAAYNRLFILQVPATAVAGPSNLTWNRATGNGSVWDTGTTTDWNNGTDLTAFNASDNVTFTDSNNAHYAVTLNGIVSPSSISVNNSAGNYTIGGTGGIGGTTGLTKQGTGTLTLATTNTFTGNMTVLTGTMNITGSIASTNIWVFAGATLNASGSPNAGLSIATSLLSTGVTTLGPNAGTSGPAAITLASVAINSNGASKVIVNSSPLHANRSVLVVNALTFLGSSFGQLDLQDNDLIIHGSTLAAVQPLVKSGLNLDYNGYWDGLRGIIDSTAAGDTTRRTTLGAIANNNGGSLAIYSTAPGNPFGSFDGQNTASTDILVKYTYYGDADLNGRVDGSDFSQIDNGFNTHLKGWLNGDFNYDDVVDGTDYSLIDNVFNTQGSPLGGSVASRVASAVGETSGSSASSAIPEPGTLSLLGLGAVGLSSPPPP